MLKNISNPYKIGILVTILIIEIYVIGYLSLYWSQVGNNQTHSSSSDVTRSNSDSNPDSNIETEFNPIIPDYSEIYTQIDESKEKNTTENISQREDTTESQNSTENTNSTNTQENQSNTNNNDPYAYPDNILTTTRPGDDLLVLVNKQYQLPSTYAPSDLVSINNTNIPTKSTGYLLRQQALNSLQNLFNTAQTQGLSFTITSAYRSYTTQQQTYNYWVSYNGGNTAAADTISARAGHSQHQLGTAVDFTCQEVGNALTTEFANTRVGQWLAQNSWQYGFVIAYPQGLEAITGFNYEPWHFRYIGEQNAQAMHQSGKILEVWLKEFN